MIPILRNILGVIVGALIGGVVNMSIIQLSYVVMPIEGLDPNDLESFAAIFPNLEAKFFILPFLAHALGTLVGAILAAWISAKYKIKMGLIIGVFFLLGGIAAVSMIPSPMWFAVTDLVLAYIPMAWMGGTIGAKIGSSSAR